ncbi:RraA family protein [Actinoplanes sp. NPDC051851]|uniref:RraA family protein n=1 Tax=Actinoplanes sp. NPDC051851 TaxID=3154753 RepID=UPI003413B252
MTLTIGTPPASLSDELVAKLTKVSFPTIGHYLEEGFVEPGIQRQCGTNRVVGRAITVRLTGQDSTLLHHAAGYCEPGDVFVVDMGGDTRHAPVGEVLAEVLHARGAAGVIIDGVMTDIDEVEPLGLPVYARGRSVLTTKLLHLDAGGVHVPVSVGGVVVNPGDVVLADRNGVFVAAPAVLESIVDVALEDDAEEPDLVRQVRGGERLGDLTGATEAVNRILEARR